MSAPLEGVRVVDFTHVLAGPACAYMLGLLGAEVIKVEGPDGEAMRWRGGTDADAAAAGRSTAWLAQAAGKLSLVLDLETAAGREAMHRLLARSDVLVENHRPATLRRLGLDDLDVRHPRLIHCAMTGYGRGGALSDAPAYDVNIQAASGLMSVTGTEATGPLRAGAPVVDYATALAAGFAICAALTRRARDGAGAFVDVSMLETALTLMSSQIADMTATNTVPQPRGVDTDAIPRELGLEGRSSTEARPVRPARSWIASAPSVRSCAVPVGSRAARSDGPKGRARRGGRRVRG